MKLVLRWSQSLILMTLLVIGTISCKVRITEMREMGKGSIEEREEGRGQNM